MDGLDAGIAGAANLGGLKVSTKENALYRRYTAKPKLLTDITFEFTRDPVLLHQYRELYERECRVAYHVPGFREAESKYNSKSHILVVRRGNLCIGGGRLSIRTPRKTDPLPLELDGFKLEDALPELKHKQMRYGEFSRLVLLPEFRDGDTTLMMWRHFYRKCVALNLDVVFAAAPLPNLRSYRKNTTMIGIKESQIHMDIDIPLYPSHEYVKDYLLSMVVDKVLIKQKEWEDIQLSEASYPEEEEI